MTRLTGALLVTVLRELDRRGFTHEIEWAEQCAPPATAREFAREVIFVICNSGMQNRVARTIFERVTTRLYQGLPIDEPVGSDGPAFRHKGKVAAIVHVWRARRDLHAGYLACDSDDERLTFLGALPWIGEITRHHIARNFGVNTVKPDVHLQRLADHHGETPLALCERLAGEVNFRVGTVDAILWRASAEGIIDSRSGTITVQAPVPRPLEKSA
jgi:hypothetical protein